MKKQKCTLTLKTGDNETELKPYQHPIGIRHDRERPAMVLIDCHQEYNQEQLLRFAEYLVDIAYSLKINK